MTKHHHLLQLAAHHGLACEAQDPVHGDCGVSATWIDRNGFLLCEACADDSLVEVAPLTAGAIRALGDGLVFDVQDYFRRAEEEGSTMTTTTKGEHAMQVSADLASTLATIAVKAARYLGGSYTIEAAVDFAWWSVSQTGAAAEDEEDFGRHIRTWIDEVIHDAERLEKYQP